MSRKKFIIRLFLILILPIIFLLFFFIKHNKLERRIIIFNFEYCKYWKLEQVVLPENDSEPVLIKFNKNKSSLDKMGSIYNTYKRCTSIVKEQYPGHKVKCYFSDLAVTFSIETDNDLSAKNIFSNICVSPKDISKYFPEIISLELRDDPILWSERQVKFIEEYNDPNSYIDFKNLERIMFEYKPSQQVIEELLHNNKDMIIEFYYSNKTLT